MAHEDADPDFAHGRISADGATPSVTARAPPAPPAARPPAPLPPRPGPPTRGCLAGECSSRKPGCPERSYRPDCPASSEPARNRVRPARSPAARPTLDGLAGEPMPGTAP